jgi:hypothetical protein
MKRPIPSELGLLTKLTGLNLENSTALTGGIPSSLGSVTQLRLLRLGITSLAGVVPAEMCDLVEHHALGEIQVQKAMFQVSGIMSRSRARGNHT